MELSEWKQHVLEHTVLFFYKGGEINMNENKITFKYIYNIDKKETEIEIEGYASTGDYLFATANCLAEILFDISTSTEEETGFDRSEIKKDIMKLAKEKYLKLCIFGRESE